MSHLRVLEYEGALDVWDDRRIEAGNDWRHEIETALDRATVAILIVSKDFLTSPFIRQHELTSILAGRNAGRLRVIPLIAEACAWQQVKDLQGLQARPRDGRPLSAAAEHQVDEDLAALAVEIVNGRENDRVGLTPPRASHITQRAWLVIALAISGIAAAALVYAASHWHLDTDVRLELLTERLSFDGRGARPQRLGLGIEFSRLTYRGCGSVEFEGLLVKAAEDGASPTRLICRDSDAKIALEAANTDTRLGALSSMALSPGAHMILSVGGGAHPAIQIEPSGTLFTLDVPIEQALDVVTSFVDIEHPVGASAQPRDLVRYRAMIDEPAPRHAMRVAFDSHGVDIVATLAPNAAPPVLEAPVSVDRFAITKESAEGYAMTALVGPGSLAYVDYPTIQPLRIAEDAAVALTAMSATQIRELSVMSTAPANGRPSRMAFKVAVEGRLEKGRVGRGDPVLAEKSAVGRWTDPRLTVYDVVTNGWWRVGALTASWTVATIAGAYVGWKKLSTNSADR